MTPAEVAAAWEDLALGQVLVFVLVAVAVAIYLHWEWEVSRVDREQRQQVK